MLFLPILASLSARSEKLLTEKLKTLEAARSMRYMNISRITLVSVSRNQILLPSPLGMASGSACPDSHFFTIPFF